MTYRSEIQKEIVEARLRSTITNEVIAEEVARREALGLTAESPEAHRFAEAHAVTHYSSTAQTGCECEQSQLCLTVVRAAEWNERRPWDAPKWEVPDWVKLEAAIIEAGCNATVHYPSLLDQTWYGNDVLTSVDDEKVEQTSREYEDVLAGHSSRDDVEERWDGEYDSYLSQAEFVAQLTAERRRMLASLIETCGGDVTAPETQAWVKSRIEAKSGNRLRGYSSCIASLRNRIERGEIVNGR
jgi:hypothetical protein